jgi:hypothetical protein
MTPDRQQLIDAIAHISFEMNRYLYTSRAISLPGRYGEIVAESCLLHSRNIGEFFFEKINDRYDDIRIGHYCNELLSKGELENELNRASPNWKDYKTRVNKQLSHLTFARVNSSAINMQEKSDINFDILIKLFEDSLPIHFKENWHRGKSFSPQEASLG